MTGEKRCSGPCGRTLPADATHFRRDGAIASGLSGRCHDCVNARERERKARLRSEGRVSPASPPSPAPRAPVDSDVRTIVILSDVHVPEHDRPMWAAVLAFLGDVRPSEIVLNGDFGEFASCSQHGGVNTARLTDDFADVKRALNELHEASPDSRIVYLEGNHEDRVARAIASWAPALTESVSVPDGLDLEERGIVYVSERHQPLTRGNLRILHGHQFGGKFGGGKYHAAKAAEIYGGTPGTISIHGHTHRPQSFTRPVVGGTVTAIGLGCGRTIGPDQVRWLHGAEAGWQHGFAIAFSLGDLWQVYPVAVLGGRFVWGGKVYDGSAHADPR